MPGLKSSRFGLSSISALTRHLTSCDRGRRASPWPACAIVRAMVRSPGRAATSVRGSKMNSTENPAHRAGFGLVSGGGGI
jgi:hypothetical protein